MNNPFEEFSEPSIPPHTYPMWLLVITAIIAVASVYSVILLPRYYAAAHLVEMAKAADDANDNKQAITLLAQAGRKVPDSKKIRIEYAYECFKSSSPQMEQPAMDALSGVSIDADEWARLSTVMPAELQSSFRQEDK